MALYNEKIELDISICYVDYRGKEQIHFTKKQINQIEIIEILNKYAKNKQCIIYISISNIKMLQFKLQGENHNVLFMGDNYPNKTSGEFFAKFKEKKELFDIIELLADNKIERLHKLFGVKNKFNVTEKSTTKIQPLPMYLLLTLIEFICLLLYFGFSDEFDFDNTKKALFGSVAITGLTLLANYWGLEVDIWGDIW